MHRLNLNRWEALMRELIKHLCHLLHDSGNITEQEAECQLEEEVKFHVAISSELECSHLEGGGFSDSESKYSRL